MFGERLELEFALLCRVDAKIFFCSCPTRSVRCVCACVCVSFISRERANRLTNENASVMTVRRPKSFRQPRSPEGWGGGVEWTIIYVCECVFVWGLQCTAVARVSGRQCTRTTRYTEIGALYGRLYIHQAHLGAKSTHRQHYLVLLF